MRDISRREAMETMLLASAGLTLTTVINAESQTPAAPKAFAGQHQPRPLPFDPTRLKGISEKLIKSHWENNYGDGKPGGDVLNAIKQAFVSYDQWEAEFKRTGNALGDFCNRAEVL